MSIILSSLILSIALCVFLCIIFLNRSISSEKSVKIDSILTFLPNLNCGACEEGSCMALAETIVKNPLASSSCTMMSNQAENALKMHLKQNKSLRKNKEKPYVACSKAPLASKELFSYEGYSDCRALKSFLGGNRVCKDACLGLGTCIKECPRNAISFTKDGSIKIDDTLCIGCLSCKKICPTGVIKSAPLTSDFFIACNSNKESEWKHINCDVACDACFKCERVCLDGGFYIRSFLAGIDYNRQGNRENAFRSCHTKVIRRFSPLSEQK